MVPDALPQPRQWIESAALDYETVMRTTSTRRATRLRLPSPPPRRTTASPRVSLGHGIGPTDTRRPASNAGIAWHVAIAVQRKFEVAAPDFKKFPFDQQYFQFEISINQADIFSCSDITSELNITGESGRTNLRNLIADGKWIAFNMSAAHPLNQDGGACQSGEPCKATCIVTLQCRRDNVIFAIKQQIALP